MTPEPGLPSTLTSFVGRDAELRSIDESLGSARLLTLAGPGGCGKTRLAIRAAVPQDDRWPDGVWWIDLTMTSDPAAVPELVAGALGAVHTVGQDSTGSLAQQLRGRRILICLDNCEHVLTAAADVVAGILSVCQEVTVLATSREPLRVPGEVVWRVPPLSNTDSVALFTARAGRIVDTEQAAAAVRTACARLEGMPLAVELAASWSDTMSPQEILDGLDDRFRLLVRGPHGVAERQQTLAASMAWSHDLLDEPDRVLFDQLGVFRTGFTAAAARGVCVGDGDIRPALRRLIEKSLLVADTGASPTRYRMLETVREYSAAQLAASSDLDRLRDRHLTVYLEIADSARDLLDIDKDTWLALVTADYENFRAAIEWGLSRDDPEPGRRLAAALPWFWHNSRRGTEGLDLLRQAIDRGADERTELQARLLTGLALVADTIAPLSIEFDPAKAGLELAEEVGDRRTACLATMLTAVGALYTDFDMACDLAAKSDALAREIGDGFVRDAALALRGIVCHLRDQHEQAMPMLQTAVDGLIPRGDRGVAATALGFLATSAASIGELPRAHALALESVQIASPLGDYHRVGSAHTVLAHVAAVSGRFEEAWAAIDPVLRLFEGVQSPPFVPAFTQRIGFLHLWSGEPARAVEWFERELDMFGAVDENYLSPRCRIGLALARHEMGEGVAAAEHAAIALQLGRDFGMPGLIADALEVQALLATEAEPARAEDLHHEALALRVERGLRPSCLDSLEALAELATRAGSSVEADRIMGACESARRDLGYPPRRALPPGDEDVRAQGRTMTLDEAVSYARRARGRRSRPASGWASLTPTEMSVVDLAIDGLSNPEIGQRLFMSRATVKTHLSHVYAKLGVVNRTQLATAARQASPSLPRT